MCNEDKLLELMAYIKASEHRQNIVKYLGDELKTPSEIGEELDIRTNHISNLLADLRKKDIVLCATPNVKKGRLYKLTDTGKRVSTFLK